MFLSIKPNQFVEVEFPTRRAALQAFAACAGTHGGYHAAALAALLDTEPAALGDGTEETLRALLVRAYEDADGRSLAEWADAHVDGPAPQAIEQDGVILGYGAGDTRVGCAGRRVSVTFASCYRADHARYRAGGGAAGDAAARSKLAAQALERLRHLLPPVEARAAARDLADRLLPPPPAPAVMPRGRRSGAVRRLRG